jgi:putative heme-binding domain-containing protein
MQIQDLASMEGLALKNASDSTFKGYKLNIRIQATRILGENEVSAAVPFLIRQLADKEPRIRTAAMGSLDRIGWGKHSEAILDAVALESDRVAYYTNWQVMRRQIPEAKRRKLIEDGRIGIRRMAVLGLMEEGDRDLQRREGEFLGGGVAEGGDPSKSLTISVSEVNFRESTRVRFTAATPGDIYYTLDGDEPTVKATKAKGEFEISRDVTVKAAVFKGDQRVSGIETLTLHKITDSEWQDRLFVRDIGGKGSAKSYQAKLEGLQRGTLVYADRNYTFTQIPEVLAGATHIRTYNDDKSGTEQDFLHFNINLPATLYLAYDGRATPPKALVEGMEKTDMVIRMSNSESFLVYRSNVNAGKVMLGGNKLGGSGGESMYQVFLANSGLRKINVAAASNAMAKADLKHGEEIFFGRGTCFACHKVHGKGVVLGPDLVGINKRQDLNYVIKSIIEPDAYIVEGFQQTSLKLKDGRELFGMIQEETVQVVKIYLPTGKQVVVQAREIVKRSDAKHSGMPASFAYTLSAQDTADLAAWIMSLK